MAFFLSGIHLRALFTALLSSEDISCAEISITVKGPLVNPFFYFISNMATVTLPQGTMSASSEAVDKAQFKALEQRVDALVTQLQQLSPPLGGSRKNVQKSQKFPLPRVPSLQNLMTPDSMPGTPDLSVTGSPAILAQDSTVPVTNRPSAKLANDILDIIQRYGKNIATKDAPWPGKAKFLPIVESYVTKEEPVRMVLPAFPFKSPNRKDKTLGSLPDLGEELALMHLNGLCETISEIYSHGANVVITSDGLVYNGR